MSADSGILARTAFRTAMAFLAVTAGAGLLLRLLALYPVSGFNYVHWLHTHSHVAFMGWVFNACFAVSLVHFVAPPATRAWLRLFLILQAGVLGMMLSFPVQGYGPVSIAFSTLHLGAAAVYAWRLWRHHTATAAARPHLRIALLALVLSGLGPLALGPLAALDLRESPAYTLSIYYYLHTHYNGWFVFFLQAVALQLAGSRADATRAGRAALWLGAGLVLTFAQSTLWLSPPFVVRALAALGGTAQLVGAFMLLRALASVRAVLPPGCIRWLTTGAVTAWLLKLLLQGLAVLPALDALVNHRFTVIAFLHLVFLGIVTPGLFALALRQHWLPRSRATAIGLVVFLGSIAVSQAVLVAVPLGAWPPAVNPLPVLAGAAGFSAAGALGLALLAGRHAPSAGGVPA